MSRIGNDNIHQGLKIVSSDDNIHSSMCVAGEKVRNFSLCISSTLQCDNYNGILKRIMSHYRTSNIANGYPNHQLSNHIDIVKDM
jgi:hypothetical protein